jgi:DNA-directed RNA polymerase subunit RPC12/RpoP
VTTKTYPCTQCGAKLEFAAGQHALVCPYCGNKNAIETDQVSQQQAQQELDYQAYLEKQAGNETSIEAQLVKCNGCGAQSQLPAHVVADRCPFCAAPLIASHAYKQRIIQPKAIAPFLIKEAQARQEFKQWIDSLWFAPNALKQAYRAAYGLKGIYIPYWTYDAKSDTDYRGQRGINHTRTETYSENGETRTRQVTVTHWTPVAGHVQVSFDDVLVMASQSLPTNYADNLAPWNLSQLQAYTDDYVAGFTVEAYQVGLQNGFTQAQTVMEAEIQTAIRYDIGGDHQRIDDMYPQYHHIQFKHILLPIWLSSYQYGGKSYRFLVNGQSGKVKGERPYSVWKIAGAVLLGLSLVAGVVFMMQQT